MKLTRPKKSKPALPSDPPPPTFEEAKAVMAKAVSIAGALLSVIAFTEHKKSPKEFSEALKGVGLGSKAELLSAIDALLPFFTAGANDTLKFRARVMEEMTNG